MYILVGFKLKTTFLTAGQKISSTSSSYTVKVELLWSIFRAPVYSRLLLKPAQFKTIFLNKHFGHLLVTSNWQKNLTRNQPGFVFSSNC